MANASPNSRATTTTSASSPHRTGGRPSPNSNRSTPNRPAASTASTAAPPSNADVTKLRNELQCVVKLGTTTRVDFPPCRVLRGIESSLGELRDAATGLDEAAAQMFDFVDDMRPFAQQVGVLTRSLLDRCRAVFVLSCRCGLTAFFFSSVRKLSQKEIAQQAVKLASAASACAKATRARAAELDTGKEDAVGLVRTCVRVSFGLTNDQQMSRAVASLKREANELLTAVQNFASQKEAAIECQAATSAVVAADSLDFGLDE